MSLINNQMEAYIATFILSMIGSFAFSLARHDYGQGIIWGVLATATILGVYSP